MAKTRYVLPASLGRACTTRHSGMQTPNMISSLVANRYLIYQLVRREVVLKYRGSVLGLGWSFLYPLLLLAAFTLVFGGVFGGRWGEASEGRSGIHMALFIYCGLAVFTPFAEVMTNAPRLLLSNQNFVKKIVFPTEILPVVSLLAASLHGLAHLALLALGAFLTGHRHPSALLITIVLLPAWLFTLGLAWFITAAGAYLRDLAHGIPVLAQFLMFVLPVFYPGNAAPGVLKTLNTYNPLARAMEDMRGVLLTGQYPDWTIWLSTFAMGAASALLGYVFFMRCREEFADVL